MPAQQQQQPPAYGYFLLAGVTLFWGLNFPAMKVVLNELPPLTFRAVCLLSGGAGLLLIARLGGLPLGIPRRDLPALLLAALFNITAWHVTSAFGISLMPSSGRAMIIAYTMPIWAALVSRWLLKEAITARRVAGLVLGMAGLAALIGPDLGQVIKHPAGSLFMLGAAWGWATGTVLVKRTPWSMPLVTVTAWMFLLGGAPIVAAALALDHPAALLHLSGKAVLALVYVIGLPMLFCHWGYYRMVTIFPVSLASLAMLIAPVVGVMAGALWLGEPLGWSEISSLGLVVAGLAVVLLQPNRGRA